MNINKLKLQELEKGKKPYDQIKINSNINLESEHWKVIEKIVYKSEKRYNYVYIIQCKQCGELKKIWTSDFKNIENGGCQNCNTLLDRQEFVGTETPVYKVLEFDRVERQGHTLRRFYKVQCKKCGSISIMRKDVIQNAKGPGCKICNGNNRVPTKDAPLNVYYNNYRTGAISRNLEWKLSLEEFKDIVSKNCCYCGQKPIEKQSLIRYNKTNSPILVNGIDRIDSSKGYSKENCVPCCFSCNRMKSNLYYKDFLHHIRKIYRYSSSTTIEKTLEKLENET